MDTSKIYVKMCEKAEEIQKPWQPSIGDWFLHDYHGTTGFGKSEDTIWPDKEEWDKIECLTYKPSIDDYIEVSEANGSHGVYTSSDLLKDRHVWLPRQDQLQEMTWDFPFAQAFDDLERFSESVSFKIVKQQSLPKLPTWEQLWLAFAMKEKYDKVWDGTNWKPNN